MADTNLENGFAEVRLYPLLAVTAIIGQKGMRSRKASQPPHLYGHCKWLLAMV